MADAKRCPRCGETKPLSEFYPHRTCAYCKACSVARANEWKENNFERRGEIAREWTKNNPDKRREAVRRNALKKKYGMTTETFDKLIDEQGGKCAICQSPDPRAKNWHIDHCHKQGHVRGLLCRPCNVGLGFAYDDPAILGSMIDYLERNNSRITAYSTGWY